MKTTKYALNKNKTIRRISKNTESNSQIEFRRQLKICRYNSDKYIKLYAFLGGWYRL